MRNLKKSGVIIVIALLFGATFTPVVGGYFERDKEKTGTVIHAFGDEEDEEGDKVIVERHYADGSVERREITLSQEKINALWHALMNASPLEERLGIMKDYHLISMDLNAREIGREMEMAGERLGIKPFNLPRNFSPFSTTNFNATFNMFCLVGIISLGWVFIFPAGTSLLTGLLNLFLINNKFPILSVDLATLAGGIGVGLAETKGIFGEQRMPIGDLQGGSGIFLIEVMGFVGLAVFAPTPFGGKGIMYLGASLAAAGFSLNISH